VFEIGYLFSAIQLATIIPMETKRVYVCEINKNWSAVRWWVGGMA